MSNREIWQIAKDIREDWRKPYFGAVPYLHALGALTTVQSKYGMDDAKTIILYFLSNASSWRGDKAKAIKAELKQLIK